MPADSSVLTVEYKMNLLAPGDGELLIADGQVLKAGRNLVISRAEVLCASRADGETHCATMQQTLMTMHGQARRARVTLPAERRPPPEH
ncbi:MAG: PaaI family thioesterase [Comamonadaceae bacterium]|nr:PaaI family thioesterase [Comamonadaceae bacterium]